MSPEAKAARRAYRDSMKAGTPLGQRQLTADYGPEGVSKRWGESRIKECQRGPQLAADAQ